MQTLYPCVRCVTRKVLNPFDYCSSCARRWHPGSDVYYLVTGRNYQEVAEETGLAEAYLKAKQEATFEEHCSYVVYYAQETWHELTISDYFNVAAVMKLRLRKT